MTAGEGVARDPAGEIHLPTLEYGKPCLDDTGTPVPGAPPGCLARTEDFPTELGGLCSPEGLGPSWEPGSLDTLRQTGALLASWPLRVGHRLVRVSARAVLQREGVGARECLRACYVVDLDARVAVSAVIASLLTRPLLPWTAGSTATSLAVAGVQPDASPGCVRAASLLVDGHRLHLASLESSLGWLAAVEARIPPLLSAVLSVGAGCAPRRDRASLFAVTFGPVAPPGVARVGADGPVPGGGPPALRAAPGAFPCSTDPPTVLAWNGADADARRAGSRAGPDLLALCHRVVGREGAIRGEPGLSEPPLRVARAMTKGARGELLALASETGLPHAIVAAQCLAGEAPDVRALARTPWAWARAALSGRNPGNRQGTMSLTT